MNSHMDMKLVKGVTIKVSRVLTCLSEFRWASVQPGSYASRKPSFALLGKSWGWTKGTPRGHPISIRIFAHGLSTLWMWLSHSLRLQNRSLMPFLSAISWTLSFKTLCASSLNLLEGGKGLLLGVCFLLLIKVFIDPVPAFHRPKDLLLKTFH